MRGPLRRLILVATVVVALVAVSVSALAALQLAGSIDSSEARAAVATQADRLAAATPEARQAAIDGISQLSDPSALVAVIDADGTAHGSAAAVVPPRVMQRLLAGGTVSTTVERSGVSYLLEARPIAGGGVVAAQDVATIRSVWRGLLGSLLLALGIGFAVATLVAVIAARRLSRPLVRMAAAAGDLAAGHRNVRLPRSGIDELGQVEAALESLSAALERSEARQREFLLSISHELRTPLTAIRGYAEALRDGVVEGDQVADVGATLDAEAMRLAAFTDDLLALARLEADDFPLHPVSVALAAIVEATADAWRGAARAAEVELSAAASEDDVRVHTDPHRIRQVLDGLIENALRVSPAGSAIRMSVTAAHDGAVLAVADGGPGLTADDAAHAFERGVLRDRYQDVRSVGTGLGLSIATRLVRRLGGTITAAPDPGGGTVFRITLPAFAPDVAAEPD